MTTVAHDWSASQDGYVCQTHGERISNAQIATNRSGVVGVVELDTLVDYTLDQVSPGSG